MLYTIKNQCLEVPELVYNDGVKILYFYTTGKKGGNDSLKRFLTYLEESKDSNATDDATREISSYVKRIKTDSEIGGKYMTVGDLIDKIVEEAVEEALAEKAEVIAEKDEVIAEKDGVIARKDVALAEKDEAMTKMAQEISMLRNQIKNME